MAIAMKAGGYGGGYGGGISETLPPMVANFKAKAGNQKITLSWTNPKSEHLAGVLITYSTTKMPENPMDGETVDAKLAETITLTGLTNDVEYFIRVFPYNKEEQYQTVIENATVSATPKLYSAIVSNLTVVPAGATPTISWANPTSDPLYRETILIQTTDKPSVVPEDGVEVYRGAGTSYKAKGLIRSTAYYWTAYTISTTEQVSPAVSTQDPYSYNISSTLNDNSWDIISGVAKEGTGANYWKIGDCKQVPISGSASGYGFNGNYYPFIIGFNHNEQLEGKGIDFQFGKTALSGGKDIAFQGFKMNNSNVNNGGWNNSLMRKTTCSQFYNILPSELKAVIAPRTKYTDNTGGGSDNAGYVTATQDRIFILAEFETFGARSYANSAEKNKQKQYEYYRLGNKKIRYDAKNNGNAVYVWLRSPSSSYSNCFCIVYTDGTAHYHYAGYAVAFAPAFKL